MPLGRYTEKYELNGPSNDAHRDGYGSIMAAKPGSRTSNLRDAAAANYEDDEDAQLILKGDPNEDARSSNDQGLTMAPTAGDDKGCYFRDGERKIDFVLVYEEETSEQLAKTQRLSSAKSDKRNRRHDLWRQKFMASLTKAGLDLEEELLEGERQNIHFIKISAPWPVLVHYAEELSLRAPLQAHPNPSTNWSDRILRAARIPNIMREDVPNRPLDYYTCPFRKSKLDKFLGSENQEEYFTTTQRIRIVYEILERAAFGKRRRAEIGIARLLEEKVYDAAFPLHDGPYRISDSWATPASFNKRQILYRHWASWGKWYKYQPLDHIREYFGEKIGIYFAWLGFYTGWLLPAAVVGLVVFLYGLVTVGNDSASEEICESGKTFRMCPLCEEKDGCRYWYLSEMCAFTKLTRLVDHPGTVFYAIFISFWAVTFLEYWKRKSVSLAHHWDCMDYEEEEETPRPDFAAKAPNVERNPITGIKEPSFPYRVRLQRIAVGACSIALMICLVFVFILAVIIYRILISIPLFQSESLRGSASFVASTSGAVVNLIFILVLGKVYEKLALRLTRWEMHRTQTDFDTHLTFKIFLFQFVNFYSSIFYIAFFKGRFAGYPGHYQHLLGLRNEECTSSGCLTELSQQLAVIMIGIQIMNNIKEILWPKIKCWWHKRRTKMRRLEKQPRWVEDYQLAEDEGLFQEYLEMVLQFGFITIFVAAFPLAPILALLNNWVEIRLDARKFIRETRRIVAERAQNIGVWFRVLELMAHLAVVSNAFLIAFASDFLPKLLYQYEYDWDLKGYVNFTLSWAPNGTLSEECRYRDFRDRDGDRTPFYWRLLAVRLGFVILFEHVVFSVCRFIDVLVPDIPKTLELKIKRERYLAKQALADSDTIMKVARRRDDDDEEEEEEEDDDVAVLTSRGDRV